MVIRPPLTCNNEMWKKINPFSSEYHLLFKLDWLLQNTLKIDVKSMFLCGLMLKISFFYGFYGIAINKWKKKWIHTFCKKIKVCGNLILPYATRLRWRVGWGGGGWFTRREIPGTHLACSFRKKNKTHKTRRVSLTYITREVTTQHSKSRGICHKPSHEFH